MEAFIKSENEWDRILALRKSISHLKDCLEVGELTRTDVTKLDTSIEYFAELIATTLHELKTDPTAPLRHEPA